MQSKQQSRRQKWGPHGFAVLLALATLLVWSFIMLLVLRDAALPVEASGTVLAVFPLEASQEDILASVVKAGGRPVRVSWPRNIWVVNGTKDGFVGHLYETGAVAAYGELPMGPTLAGCFAFIDRYVPGRRPFQKP